MPLPLRVRHGCRGAGTTAPLSAQEPPRVPRPARRKTLAWRNARTYLSVDGTEIISTLFHRARKSYGFTCLEHSGELRFNLVPGGRENGVLTSGPVFHLFRRSNLSLSPPLISCSFSGSSVGPSVHIDSYALFLRRSHTQMLLFRSAG